MSNTWLDAIDMRATAAPVRPDTAMVSLCGSLKKPLPKKAPIVTLDKDNRNNTADEQGVETHR